MKGNILYGKYSVISNKTIRKPESQYKSWFSTEKEGKLVKTARGYFLNGEQIDLHSVYDWFIYNHFEKDALSLVRNFK